MTSPVNTHHNPLLRQSSEAIEEIPHVTRFSRLKTAFLKNPAAVIVTILVMSVAVFVLSLLLSFLTPLSPLIIAGLAVTLLAAPIFSHFGLQHYFKDKNLS